MLAHSRLQLALEVLEKEYQPSKLPLSRFLKQWFKGNKKMGSTDRRILSSFMYEYYRCYHLLSGLENKDRILGARFLLNRADPMIIEQLRPEWLPLMQLSKHAKLKKLKDWYPSTLSNAIFQFEGLSAQIDSARYAYSYLEQPKLFIRMCRGFERKIMDLLNARQIPYHQEADSCLAFENQTKLECLELELAGRFEIQDINSQRTASFFSPKPDSLWWDACAGSGGKSLLLADMEPRVRIYASDSRESSLENYRTRMKQAGFRACRIFMSDLYRGLNLPTDLEFDGIILDAPCSGSGTWARTPEMLAVFEDAKLKTFTALQLQIAKQVVPFLKPGGVLIYITCSVFEAENEGLVSKLLAAQPDLLLEKQSYLSGYTQYADTLFVAKFVKSRS